MSYSKLIDNYLDGLLSEVEMEAFEERLCEDTDFRKLVEEYKRIDDFIKEQFEIMTLEQILSKIMTEEGNESPTISQFPDDCPDN